ncbi:MAG: hypothetical protein AAF125_02585 [Chloroflexota bacterium]
MMPYWLSETLLAIPAFMAVFVLLGVPLALSLLPRQDWADHPLVAMTAFALGPATLTAGLLALGSLPGARLTPTSTFTMLASMTIFVWAWFLWRVRTSSPTKRATRALLTPGERLLLTMIGAAVAVRFLVAAYWPFTAYDALWVYGYEARLYTLVQAIPPEIDYYPQFVPLLYTFGHFVAGGIADGAARAVLPLLQLGAILAAYNLGARAFNRRAGIALAALWTLYPAVGEWSRMGDLEIPMAFLVTGAAVFFFMSWAAPLSSFARRYALLAGLIYGVALWTKPTAGGFALGVMLICTVELVRLRFDWTAFRPRFMVALWTAIACAPLGGVWYLRNIALGHNAIDFPPTYWYSLAERSGGQLLWYIAGACVLAAYLAAHGALSRHGAWGVGLMIVGVLPSVTARWTPTPPTLVLTILPSLEGLPRMGAVEWGLVIVGLGLFLWGVWRAREALPQGASLVGWMLLATFPYMALYFWRYSYHYRLSFAVVPMMAAPIALTLAAWVPNADVRVWRPLYRYGLAAALFFAALPGIVLPFYDPFLGWDYLWSDELPDDTAKRTSGNEALMWMVDGFQIYEAEHGAPPSVIAPGVQRLPFFFPLADLEIETAPTQLTDLENVVYFVNSHPDGTGMYEDVPLAQNQVLSALGRTDIMRWAWGKDDGIFRYDIYELHLSRRWERPQPVNPADGDVTFGGFARLLGHDIVSDVFEIGQRRVMKLFWEVTDTPDRNYSVYIHLRGPDDTLYEAWDGPVALTDDGLYYTTLVWEPGEFIADERAFRLTNEDVPPGEGYQLVFGIYDPLTGERVPILQDGEEIGDGYNLGEQITVIPPQ